MTALSVLLLEDDPLIGILLSDMLEDMGFGVCAIAATEEAAATAGARYRPDLIIADARLGPGSGVAAVADLLRAGFVPHLFVTGDTFGVRVLRPDAVVLQKPFREADLKNAIGRALAVAAPVLADPVPMTRCDFSESAAT